jgi:cation transport regulator ChaC
MLTNTYNAIAHATDVQGIAAALGGVTRTYMPEASEMVGIVAGSGSVYGMANGLRTLGRYADVGDNTPWAREMQRRELVTANIKAIAHAGLESAQDSVAHLGAYLGLISDAEDGTAVSAVGNGVAVEQQNLLNHQAQLQQVQMMLATEDRVERQRAEQMQWESARQMYEDSGQLGGGE